jgi:xanthine dehydrogenase molybdopterin-binding subunit B
MVCRGCEAHPSLTCSSTDPERGLFTAPLLLESEFELGGQEHFYLETHAAWAKRGEDGSVFVDACDIRT